MNAAAVIAGLVAALVAVIFAWSGMPLAWGIVMVLALALVGVIVFCIAILPKWPG